MSCEFVTVYAAAIITNGKHAFVKRNGKPFLYLEGVQVNPWDGMSPKNCLLDKLGQMIGFHFSTEWLRYIGATIHCSEYSPGFECRVESSFIVQHYWLDIQNFPEFEYTVTDVEKVLLSEMCDNVDNRFLYADSLAAKRVLELQDRSFNDLQKLT